MATKTTTVEDAGAISTFRLPNKKVAVKPVVRDNGWLDSKHDGYFMFTGGVVEYCVPMDLKRNRLVKVLSQDEEDYLAQVLGADLRINLQGTNNFFKTDKRAKVRITKDDSLMKTGFVLDLSDPMDYLHYKILLANRDQVAPEWEQRYNKPTYKFVLVSQDQEEVEKLKAGSSKAEAYKFYETLKDSHTRMVNFLTVYGQKPLGEVSVDFLRSQLIDIIESPKLYEFLKVAQDPNYSDKLFIDDAVRVGAIQKIGKTKYALIGGDVIGNTLMEAVEYFKDKRNNEVLAKVKAQVELSGK